MLLALAVLLGSAPQDDAGPFVEVGVWYGGPDARPPGTATEDVEAIRSDLEALRRAGFNALTTWVRWSDAEPRKGTYALAGAERLIAAAAAADLRVAVVVFPDPPSWAGAGADAAPFVAYAAKRLSLNPAVLRVAAYSQDLERMRIEVRDSAPAARLAMWAAIARGDRAVSFMSSDGSIGRVLPLGETAGVITRNQALFAPLRPRSGGVTAVSAAGGASIDVKLLESPQALMIIGLNYAPAPQKATMTFSPDIPEAIWQNLETGTAVNFVMGKEGPFLEYTFAPRDALVLMIRKTLR